MRVKTAIAAGVIALATGCATASSEGNVVGEYLGGLFAARTNDIPAAAAAYERAHETAPDDASILKDAFFFHLAAGDVDGAAPFARKLIAVDADAEGLAAASLAAQALHDGKLQEARSLLAKRPALQFLQSVSFLTDVWIEEGLSGPDAALAKLSAVPDGVFSGFNPLHKGLLSEKAGRLDEARAAYQEAVYGLGGPVGRAAYGAFLERSGDKAGAEDYYDILAREPGPHRRQAEQARARMKSGRVPSDYSEATPAQGAAISFYSFAAAMIDEAADQRARAEAAGMQVGDPRFNFPLALARIAVYLDPQFDEAKRLAGAILNIYGNYEGAAKILREITPASPQFEQARIDIAGGEAAAGDNEAAERTLQDAVRHDSKSAELRLSLSTLYAAEDRHEEAVKALDSIVKKLGPDPGEDAWRYFVARGGSNLELGRWEAAETDLKRAVELAPDQPVALNYLGYSWAERGVHLDEAFKLIDKAVAMNPQSGALIDSLGWAHFQLGRYAEAAQHLERAAQLEPSDPTITDHLGDVYWRLGRATEAKFQWRRALELSPSDVLKTKLRIKLQNGLGPDARQKA